MTKRAWRKKFDLPPGYEQGDLFPEYPDHKEKKAGLFGMALRFLAVVFTIAVFTAYLTQQIYLMNLNHDIALLERDLETIHQDNEVLRLQYAQTENLANIEKIALNKLGMVRPQQIIYIRGLELANR